MDHRIAKDMISSGMIPSGEKKQDDLNKTQYGTVPSPDALSDVYKKMYKEENIDEMAGKIPKITRLKPDLKAQSRAVKDAEFSDDFDRTMESGVKHSPEAQKIKQDKIKKGRESFRTGQKQENVDLLTAYRAVHEHHKKDADGNTIPHEGEEINEVAPLVAGAMNVVKKIAATKVGQAAIQGAAMSAGSNVVNKAMNSGNQNQSANKTKNVSNNPTPTTQYASADLFDIVKGQLLDEGYSEKEINEIMVNLTEEQLDEFLKALAQAGMRGAESVGKATKGLAAQAAQRGANIGKKPSEKIEVVNPKPQARKPFEPKRKPFDAKKPEPKPGDSGFKAQGAMDVVTAAAATRRKRMEKEMKPKNGEVMADNADLFDIVKGQLLDEGLSEEEIRDIMLTLTPDEILKEIEESSLSAGSSGGHYSDGGDGVFRSKQQVANMFNKNIPASKNGKVDKPTRKAINTSAKDFGIQGPSTLKQSVEPEGETI